VWHLQEQLDRYLLSSALENILIEGSFLVVVIMKKDFIDKKAKA